MAKKKKLTNNVGAPIVDNQNVLSAGKRGPMLMQDVWYLEKLAHFDREVIPERRMHAKGSGAFGTFTVTHDITKYTKAAIFSEIGKKTDLFVRFSTVAGERGAADAERDFCRRSTIVHTIDDHPRLTQSGSRILKSLESLPTAMMIFGKENARLNPSHKIVVRPLHIRRRCKLPVFPFAD